MQDGTEKALDRAAPRVRSAEEAATTTLHAGTYLHEIEIVDLIDAGEYSIVYLAYDHGYGHHVALKEYMPSAIAARSSAFLVSAKSSHHADAYTAGLRHFVDEARILSQLDSPSLVKVYRFWEENGTAYMVMPVYEGVTLKQAFKEHRITPSEDWLRALLMDLLDGIEAVHRMRDFHGDITPDNIMLLPDGRALLLDFNAARAVINDLTGRATDISRQGFSPIEQQYSDMPELKRGAWTDIYALAAVAYYLISGKAPLSAVPRIVNDSMVPAREVGRGSYSEGLLAVLDHALAVRPEQRIRSVAELREALRSSPIAHAATSTHRKATERLTAERLEEPSALRRKYGIPGDRAPDWYQKKKTDSKLFASGSAQNKTAIATASLVLCSGIAVGIYVGIQYFGSPNTRSTSPIVADAKPASPAAPAIPASPATSAPDTTSIPATPPATAQDPMPVPALSSQDTQSAPLPSDLDKLPDQGKQSAGNPHLERPNTPITKNVAPAKPPGSVAESKTGARERPAPADRSKQAAPITPATPQEPARDRAPEFAEQQSPTDEIPPQAKLPDSDGLKAPPSQNIPPYPAESKTSGDSAVPSPPDISPITVPSQADSANRTVITLDDQTMSGDFTMDPKTGVVSGAGSITWKNGDRYEGTLVKGSKEGKGIFEWKSGNRYSGDWAKNQPNGKGILEFRNGNRYEGQVRNGMPDGRGTFVFSNGNRYEGEVRNGQPHGKGILVFADGTRYEGDVRDGLPNGQGVTRFRSGDIYSGTVVSGKSHGQGRYTWANGTAWEGEFRNDLRTENGKIVSANDSFSPAGLTQSARTDAASTRQQSEEKRTNE